VFVNQQADATLTGGELGAEVQALDALALRGRAEFLRGTNEQTDDPLPLIPPRRAVLGAELTSTKLGWAQRARVGAEVDLVAKQNRPSPLDEAPAGYILLNLETGIERSFAGRALRADLRVGNILDKQYRDLLSRYKAFALEPGRNISLRLSIGI
jgi:iron complex outermembrane receptor protein